MSDGFENSTVQSDLRPLVPSIPFLELRIQGSYGSRQLPFLQNPLEFRLDQSNTVPAEWSVELSTDFRLLFHCRSGNRESISCLVGEELELGKERMTVVDLRTLPPYRLVSLSAELGYRVWALVDGSWTVGRPGRRSNTIPLLAASVSRTHARLEIRDKSARVVAETDSALTAVNGQRLDGGQSADLQPNDVLQIGELLFRWEREERAFFQTGPKLRIRGLGSNIVSLGTAKHDEVEFRNENARNLLFQMAAARNSELPIERILEGYWPERPVLRQRKNLSHTLKALQHELGWSEATFSQRVLRSAETLRLDPAAIESCDLWELQETIRRSRREAIPLSTLVQLHPGPLLPFQQNGWVRSLRTELFLAWLGAVEHCQSGAVGTAKEPSDQAAFELGETLTRCLRDGDFEEFVYERAFQVARAFAKEDLIQPWLNELKERLLASTGELPSDELVAAAALLSRRPLAFPPGSEQDRIPL